MNHPDDKEIQSAIRNFRNAARDWDIPAPPALDFTVKFRRAVSPWILAATAVFLAAVPLYRGNNPQPLSDATADAALLAQVDSQLSQDVPAPMEPLLNLVSWSPADLQRSEK